MNYDETWALMQAVEAAKRSPCQKSSRGVVVWMPGHSAAVTGWNHLPRQATCDGSSRCRELCGKRCVHAEVHALLRSPCLATSPLDMLHVKINDHGEPVPSGGPSCWQCSRHILDCGIRFMWLLHEDGLERYTAEEFHRLTLEACGLLP